MGHSEGSPEKEVHSNTDLPKKEKISQINKSTNLKSTRNRRTTIKAQSSRKEEIIEIRA